VVQWASDVCSAKNLNYKKLFWRMMLHYLHLHVDSLVIVYGAVVNLMLQTLLGILLHVRVFW